MTRSRKLWLLGIVVTLLAAVAGSVSIIVGTSAGTRWLLSVAEPYLPQELELGNASGNLLAGVQIDRLAWNGESTRIVIEGLRFDIELLPLFSSNVAINRLDADALQAFVLESGEADREEELPTIQLPVSISVARATIRNVSIQLGPDTHAINRIDFAGNARGSNVRVRTLAVRSDQLDVDLVGQVQLRNLYPADFQANWRLTLPDGEKLAGELGAKGDFQEIAIRHNLTEPLALATTGRIRFESDDWLAELENQWKAIDWAFPESRLRSSGGSLALRGNIKGFAADLDTNVQLDDRPEIKGLRAKANISYVDGTLKVDEGDILIGNNRASVAGVLNDLLVLDATLTIPDPNALVPGVTGSLEARVRLKGQKDQPNASIELNGAGLAWGDYSTKSVAANAQLSANGDNAVTLDIEQLLMGEQLVDEAHLAVSGLIDSHRLQASVIGLGGQLELEANGGYQQSRWEGQVQQLAVSTEALGRWTAGNPSDVALSAQSASFSRLCLTGSTIDAEACLSGEYLVDGPIAFAASLSRLQLAALPLGLSTDIKVDGHVQVDIDGTLAAGRLSGDASIELLGASASTTYEGEVVSIELAEAIGRATVVDNRVESTVRLRLANDAGSGDAQLSIGDFTDTRSAIEGQADVFLPDAAPLGSFLPSITNPKGKISGTLAIKGSMSQPDFAGEIALTDGAFALRQAGIEVTEIDLRLAQHEPGHLQLVGSAKSGEGELHVRGNARVSTDTGIRTEISISGDNVELLRTPDWQLSASPAITVVLDERSTNVTGELGIPTARIEVKTIPNTAKSPSPDAIVHRADAVELPSGRRININIDTKLGPDVKLDAFGLSTSLEGTVNLRGGTHSPYTGFGRLSLRGGRYEAYGQELEIERGELIFNGPLDQPNLDVRAVRRVDDVMAGIQLAGTPSELQSDLFSEPALSDAETLSYLLTGRPLSNATSSAEGDALVNAAYALSLTQVGPVVSQIRGQLGLETLTVEGGTEDGRIIAGKRFGDRLLVEYGYGLIDKIGTLLLRYQLSDRFMLESRTGTVSNFDIVYRVRKR